MINLRLEQEQYNERENRRVRKKTNLPMSILLML